VRENVCASGVELLMDYVEGVLSPDARANLDAHLAECPKCAAFVASYVETPRIFRAATATVMPTDLRASLRALLRAQRRG
jgi:anti-sigma factor RsiW